MSRAVRVTERWYYASAVYFGLGFLSFLYIYLIRHASYLVKDSVHPTTKLWVGLSMALPEIIIWLIAARGAIRFKEYAMSIRRSKDGTGLNHIANALLFLVLYIVLLTIGGSVPAAFHGSKSMDLIVSLTDHVPIAFILLAAIEFFRGARLLDSLVDDGLDSRVIMALWIGVALLGLAFTAGFYRDEPRVPPVDGMPRFGLPVHDLMLSYVLPHLVVWGLGVYACVRLTNYALQVKGTLYKTPFTQLTRGVILVFVATYVAQLLIISKLSNQKFTPLLGVAYALLLLAIYGFILIYRGAHRLHHIEQV